MSIDPVNAQVMSLLAPIPKRILKRIRNLGEIAAITNEKVKAARELLRQDPSLEKNVEISERLQVLSKERKSLTRFVKTVFMDLSVRVNMDSLFAMIEGKLVITQKALENIECKKETFWEQIAVLQPKKLVITRDNASSISYNRNVLKHLIDLKPELRELIEEYTLKFSTGEILVETKARLVLCGKFFKHFLRNENKTIDLPHPISLSGFSAVLSILEKGELDSTNSMEEFLRISVFLEIKESLLPIPKKGVYGKKDLEKYFGAIGDVAPFPIEAFEPNPINPNKRWIDDFEFFWMPPEIDGVKLDVNSLERIARSDKFGERKICTETYSRIRTDAKINEPIKKGYWFAIDKATRDKYSDMDYQNTKTDLQQNFPSLALPTVREAMLYCLMHHVKNRYCILGRNPVIYTRCLELIKEGEKECNVVVGALDPSMLNVTAHNHAHVSICVLLSRKFC